MENRHITTAMCDQPQTTSSQHTTKKSHKIFGYWILFMIYEVATKHMPTDRKKKNENESTKKLYAHKINQIWPVVLKERERPFEQSLEKTQSFYLFLKTHFTRQKN